jgi:hypothetical protein
LLNYLSELIHVLFKLIRTTFSDFLLPFKEQPEVNMRNFSPGAARPVIRGFDGDRVLDFRMVNEPVIFQVNQVITEFLLILLSGKD